MSGPWTSLTGMGEVVVACAWVVAGQMSGGVPTGKMEPDGGAQATVPQEPVTAGKGNVTTALHRLGSLPLMTGAEQASEQAWLQHTGSAVRKLRLQPPATLPRSPAASSVTKSCQLPLGLMPLKSERARPWGAPGRGAARTPPEPMFVGRKVPETICAESGTVAVAVSSKVRLTLSTSLLPPDCR